MAVALTKERISSEVDFATDCNKQGHASLMKKYSAMPPPQHNERNSGSGQQTNCERWPWKCMERGIELQKIPHIYQTSPKWCYGMSGSMTPNADRQPAGPYLSSGFQLPSQEQRIALVLVLGLLVVVLALPHVLKARKRRKILLRGRYMS